MADLRFAVSIAVPDLAKNIFEDLLRLMEGGDVVEEDIVSDDTDECDQRANTSMESENTFKA